MNKFLFLLIVAALLSCGDDDEAPTFSGTYEVLKFVNANCSTIVENVDLDFTDANCQRVAVVNFCREGTLIFSNDGTVEGNVKVSGSIFNLFELDGNGMYSVLDDVVTICLPDCSIFTKQDDMLILTNNDGRCDQRVEMIKI